MKCLWFREQKKLSKPTENHHSAEKSKNDLRFKYFTITGNTNVIDAAKKQWVNHPKD
jgi:hypothetical protein